jgi:CRP/FNR family transcriptional regulator, cyclic AMP receptor protein
VAAVLQPAGNVTTTHAEILARHPFTGGLTPEHLDRLRSFSSDRIFATGDFLCREGETAAEFYLLWEGRVALEVHVVGHAGPRIETIHAGEVLGWSWVAPPYRWRLDARALEPVRAVAIDAAALRRHCDGDHEFGYQILKRVAPIIGHRLHRTRAQLRELYSRTRREESARTEGPGGDPGS